MPLLTSSDAGSPCKFKCQHYSSGQTSSNMLKWVPLFWNRETLSCLWLSLEMCLFARDKVETHATSQFEAINPCLRKGEAGHDPLVVWHDSRIWIDLITTADLDPEAHWCRAAKLDFQHGNITFKYWNACHAPPNLSLIGIDTGS